MAHIKTAIQLALQNKSAKPVRYAYEDTVEASYASRTMMISGVIIFMFIVYHLMHFTLGITHPNIYSLHDPKGRHDVYSMVIFSFRDYWVCGSYILAMAVLCFHLSHGISSLFQSLGLNVGRREKKLKIAGISIASLIFIGNSSIALASLFGFLSLPPWVGH
ncbi:MAG: hypothetical protein A3D92_20485 [Bacteroidetes bacterium RIFCSPHIGHO2_02_FULL_44_7]|nr:MAG: hypothetical protein A3D92_20485 [Bacteroidetes bacterium RIFCSPHIGHO2_02_FULL_44_7]